MRNGDPAQYWYARTILVSNDEGVVRYVLLAASSPSITGNGHFFELRLAVALLLSGLGLSFLWWWPFVRHLTKPIILMTKVTERIAAGDYSSLSDDSPISLKAVGEGRGDQIGCLAKATGIMAEKVKQQVHGQRRFIRHIAHELDSPLARIKLGLAVLDSRVDEKNQQRVQEISDEVEQLSLLVEDVLSFMRSEAIPESPAREAVSLAPLLQYVTRREARDRDVRLSVDEGLKVWADASCLGRALANVVRNAVRYAGEDGPIAIAARPQGDRVCVEIRDSGPGVPAEEMEHITKQRNIPAAPGSACPSSSIAWKPAGASCTITINTPRDSPSPLRSRLVTNNPTSVSSKQETACAKSLKQIVLLSFFIGIIHTLLLFS